MSARYERLPDRGGNVNSTREMEEAFDNDSDDEFEDAAETHPLTRSPAPTAIIDGPLGAPTSALAPSTQRPPPGTYNFENTEFDYIRPPPEANYTPMEGNSHGIVPVFNSSPPRRGWFSRATSVLPSHYVERLGWAPRGRPSGAVGGGLNNDGVFANVTAKPTAPQRIQEGDDAFMVPEDTRAEAPPSYAAAQADSVPPYWETTVFAPDSNGEMIIDDLPTGSLFSFMWNMLISITFQFVGFLLTYLLHTSHAARYGSRAGLGVSLIQYGFALRSRLGENSTTGWDDSWGWQQRPVEEITKPIPTFDTAQEADAWNSTLAGSWNSWNSTEYAEQREMANLMAEASTEWLSFFMMTIGWFVLLTSVLGYLRVKRWERGILASQTPSVPRTTPEGNEVMTSRIQRAFGISSGDLMSGLGLRRNPANTTAAAPSSPRESDDSARYGPRDGEEEDAARQARTRREWEGVVGSGVAEGETESMLQATDDDPRAAAAWQREVRLQHALRDAGLL